MCFLSIVISAPGSTTIVDFAHLKARFVVEARFRRKKECYRCRFTHLLSHLTHLEATEGRWFSTLFVSRKNRLREVNEQSQVDSPVFARWSSRRRSKINKCVTLDGWVGAQTDHIIIDFWTCTCFLVSKGEE